MAHKFGDTWNYNNIKAELMNVINALNINRMPSSSEIKLVMKDYSLVNAIRRHGGSTWWSYHLDIPQRECETRTGYAGEIKIKALLESKGYEVKKMSVKHPYDLLVNGNIKIDVKSAHKYNSNKGWSSYSFNLEKSNPTCDIYVIWCMDDDKVLVIPSKFLKQNQLCITDKGSKYDVYKNRWDYISQYNDFYDNLN